MSSPPTGGQSSLRQRLTQLHHRRRGAVITDDPKVVAAVRAFIDGIEETTEVDQTFLDNATTQWQIGRAVPIPGSAAADKPTPDSYPQR